MPIVPSQATSQLRTTVAFNIDRAITAKGLTNRAVAEAIGKTEHQVWRWRRGKVMPEEETLLALAAVLVNGRFAEFYEEQAA